MTIMYYYITDISRKKFCPSNFYSLQILSSIHKRYSNPHPSLKGCKKNIKKQDVEEGFGLVLQVMIRELEIPFYEEIYKILQFFLRIGFF